MVVPGCQHSCWGAGKRVIPAERERYLFHGSSRDYSGDVKKQGGTG